MMSLRTLAKLSSIFLIVSAVGLLTVLVDQNPLGAGKSQLPQTYTTGEQELLTHLYAVTKLTIYRLMLKVKAHVMYMLFL